MGTSLFYKMIVIAKVINLNWITQHSDFDLQLYVENSSNLSQNENCYIYVKGRTYTDRYMDDRRNDAQFPEYSPHLRMIRFHISKTKKIQGSFLKSGQFSWIGADKFCSKYSTQMLPLLSYDQWKILMDNVFYLNHQIHNRFWKSQLFFVGKINKVTIIMNLYNLILCFKGLKVNINLLYGLT